MYNSVSQKLMVRHTALFISLCVFIHYIKAESHSQYSLHILISLLSCFQAKMGFKKGEGLGKFGQGRKEIVEASTQRGRRGLGLTLEGFEGDLNVEWKDEAEVRTTFPFSLRHNFAMIFGAIPTMPAFFFFSFSLFPSALLLCLSA